MKCMIENCESMANFIKQQPDNDIVLCSEHLKLPQFADLFKVANCSNCNEKQGEIVAESSEKRTLLCNDCAQLPEFKELPQSKFECLANQG